MAVAKIVFLKRGLPYITPCAGEQEAQLLKEENAKLKSEAEALQSSLSPLKGDMPFELTTRYDTSISKEA